MCPVLCWALSATLRCLLLKVHYQPLWQCCFLPTPLHPSQFTPPFFIRPFQTINAYFFLFLFSVHSSYNFILDAIIFTALPWFVVILSATLNLSYLPNLNVNSSDWDMLYIHITASAQEEAHPVHPYWVVDLCNHTKEVGASGLHIPSMGRNQEIKPATLRHWTKKPFDIKASLSKSWDYRHWEHRGQVHLIDPRHTRTWPCAGSWSVLHQWQKWKNENSLSHLVPC